MDRPGGTVPLVESVVGAGPAIQRRSVMRQERRQQHIAAFVASRSPQDDSDFIADCRILGIERAEAIAKAVREAVARSCGVEAGYIREADCFSRELYLLWGEDSLDSIQFFMDMEKRLDVAISDRDAERIITPFGGDRTVGDMVRSVCEVVGGPAAA